MRFEWYLLILLAYLVGAIPFGWVVARARGIDIRQHGSGNIGTTNVLRTMGKGASALVLLCDFGKCLLPTLLARALTGSPGIEAACALAAVIGHSWPVYLRFKGGKGVASGLGGLVAVLPWVALTVTVVGLVIIGTTKYMSLASLACAVLSAILAVVAAVWFAQPWEYVWFAVALAVIVVFRHRENINRLMAGTERKLGRRMREAT